MTDVILIAVIIAFFVAVAFLVRALGGLVADSVSDDDDDPEFAPTAPADPVAPGSAE